MNKETLYELLGKCEYDPKATRGFDVFAGGFTWSDEVPSTEFIDEKQRPIIVVRLRTVVAYRASLSFDSPRPEFELDWNELAKSVPNWPGLRDDRIHGDIQRLLKIHQYQLARAFRPGGQMDRLFDEFD